MFVAAKCTKKQIVYDKF